MWAVVHFSSDNSVDYVPSIWVKKDGIKTVCAWPNNDSNLKKFRSSRSYPNKIDYSYYKCRVISKDIALLSEAKSKTDKAQFTSDVSDGNKYNRKLKMKKSLDKAAVSKKKSSVLSGCSLTNIDKEEHVILANSDDNSNSHKTSECSETSSVIDDSDVDQNYIPNHHKQKQDTSTEIWPTLDNDIDVNNESMYAIPSTLSQSQQPLQSQLPINSASFTGFQKATLNYLAVLKVEICKIADNQQHIIQMIQSKNVNTLQGDEFNWEHEVDYFIHNWPISNKEDLINMEEKIKSDVHFQKQVVCELARIGGKSLKNMIYKIMKRVFDDKVLIAYTYYGLRNKDNFSLLSINKAIFDASKKSNFKNASNDEIITAIGKWLTSAKGRLVKKNPLENIM
ncbi:unnamed protein product [Macrosiphum euphorbiae]|uniref:DUF4806 domain-containing protein n=1 Tax=Macrosiphum euphorbiae TaxID=13131 RepID=A0AAV0WTI3_9HEMI|nr:unnamed protein product [Macrosiphum euphorbiae]